MSFEYRTPRRSDAAELSRVAHAAKAHWGYSPARLDQWASELAVTADQIASHYFLAAYKGGAIGGFIAVSTEAKAAEVEHLWVLPEHMACGIGRALFEAALRWCRNNEITLLRIVSDPNAAGFYRAMGEESVAEQASSIPGRNLPVFHIEIDG